jgi:hypothetical protein
LVGGGRAVFIAPDKSFVPEAAEKFRTCHFVAWSPAWYGNNSAIARRAGQNGRYGA